MKIPLSNHSVILFGPLAVAQIAKEITNWQGWDKCITLYSGPEAFSNKLMDYEPKIARNYPKLAWTIQKINNCLWVPSLIVTIGNGLECLSLMDKRFNFIPYDLMTESSFLMTWSRLAVNIGAYVALIPAIILAVKVVSALNNYFWKEEEASKLLEIEAKSNQSIAYAHPFRELAEETILVLRVACSVTMFAVSPKSPLLFLNLALQSYTLFTIAKREWIKYRVSFETFIGSERGQPIRQITIDLFMRIVPISPKGKNEESDCSICLDDVTNQKTQVTKGVLCCKNHAFHLNCISEWINENMGKINEGLSNFTEHLKDGRRESVSANLEKAVLPSCPSCRGVPPYEVEGSATDSRGLTVPLALTVKE